MSKEGSQEYILKPRQRRWDDKIYENNENNPKKEGIWDVS
jgi:hypothetical protein